ncbi:MAG: hypothetical protein K2X86_07110 [Cytophagaceae bacterium]|nr:hypothetical protein [Cytophagaceae bacterium]
MKFLSIQKLVEKYTFEQLQEAEYDIIQERKMKIEVEGKDQAAKLTDVIAAVWILEEMKSRNLDFSEAFFAYSQKVRVY